MSRIIVETICYFIFFTVSTVISPVPLKISTSVFLFHDGRKCFEKNHVSASMATETEIPITFTTFRNTAIPSNPGWTTDLSIAEER